MNGVSKKLCISLIGVQAIVHMSNDASAEDKIWYAVLVLGIVVVYKCVQAFVDWKNNRSEAENKG